MTQVEGKRERERENRLCSHWFIPRPDLVKAEARNQKAHRGLTCEWQGLKYESFLLLSQEAGVEVEKLGFELAL